jgi:hypothetical protein
LFAPFFYLKAHEYYFAFAEVDYNEKSAKIEATLTLSAHDFEASLQKDNVIKNSIDKAFLDSIEFLKIEKELNNSFSFSSVEKPQETKWISSFKIEGFQKLLNGNLEIYLSCDIPNSISLLTVQFNLMMDHFPDQQNKITFIRKRKKSTLNFTLANQIQKINL